MDLLALILLYLGVAILAILLLLFGESPWFAGTPVQTMHWLLTDGACQGLEWFVSKACGQRGSAALDAVCLYCWDRPNPVMQVLYLGILALTFFLYWTNLFGLLPGNTWVDESHRYFGMAMTAVCVVYFLLASTSDPGTISESNLAAHHALYNLDGVVFPEKFCPTCKFSRPARSKHCRVCNRCVARHDHHCAWINNCVGLSNLRLFLAFLAANLVLCVYGAILGALILAGDMEKERLLNLRFINSLTGEVQYLWQSPKRLVQFTIFHYPVHAALVLFLAMASLLVGFFLVYQLVLIGQGQTQYELFRRREVYRQLWEEQQQLNRRDTNSGVHTAHNTSSRWTAKLRRVWQWWNTQQRPNVEMPVNTYHKGFWHNLFEVVFWEASLKAAHTAAAADRAAEAAGTKKHK